MTSESRAPVISPMLAVADVPRAVDWYARALGATELWSLGPVAGVSVDGARRSSWRIHAQ